MRVEEYEALDEEEREGLREEASRKGKKVYSMDYDSGAPGGGGEDWVMRYRGLFFVFSLDDHPPGPFRSLREAIVEGYLTDVTSATGEILCDLPTEELLPLLTVHGDPVTVLINDEEWTFDAKTNWSGPPGADPPGPQRPEDEEDGTLFSCPFCGVEHDDCEHFLGSRDLNFCGDFGVDDVGDLAELAGLFRALGEGVAAISGPGKDAECAASKPRRLRELALASARCAPRDGFSDYLLRAGRDSRAAVRSDTYQEDGGPDFCSVVRMFWADDVPAALDGMRRRIEGDIRRLRARAGSL